MNKQGYGILYKVIDFQSALSIVLKIRFYVVFSWLQMVATIGGLWLF